MKNKLIELLKMEAEEIQTSFRKASIEGEGTPQEVADRREAVFVKSFLEKYFPFPYRVVKGNIVDSYENRSNSIDCIILSPSHPYTIDSKNDRASIIFADGVDFAIEVKPNLADKKEIARALDQIRSVKKLRRKRSAIIFKDNYNEEQIENSYKIPTFIFSDKSYSDIRLLISTIVSHYIFYQVPVSEQFDFIVINNRAMIFNSRKNSYCYSKDLEGIYISETKENTLAVFLLWLNKIMRSEPEISPNILKIYLTDDLFQCNLNHFPDLNQVLNDFNHLT
jgi:hypothetical protein